MSSHNDHFFSIQTLKNERAERKELLRQPSDNLIPLFLPQKNNHHGGSVGSNFGGLHQQQQQQPCLASTHANGHAAGANGGGGGLSRCQSRSQNKMLTRQASAGSLPPDHHEHHHHHHHMHPMAQHGHHVGGVASGGHGGHGHSHHHHSSFDDGGYKSDGEAYHGSTCYKSSGGTHRSRHNAGGCQRPMRSLSGHLIQHEPPQHQHHHHGHGGQNHHSRGASMPRNGYLSDGEGYMIQNQRVSRSGKYGSQASSPRSDHHRGGPEAMNQDESEESEDEDEDEDEEEEEDEDQDHHLDGLDDHDGTNLEQEIHLNDMVAAKEQQELNNQAVTQVSCSKAGPVSAAQADLIVSYAAFQAEAAAALASAASGESHHLRFARHKSSGSSSSAGTRDGATAGAVVAGGGAGHHPGGQPAQTSLQFPGAPPDQHQLFTMHAAVTTATVAETVRRSTSNGCVVDGPVMSRSTSEGNETTASGGNGGGGQRSRRSSRSNSRQGDYEGPPSASLGMSGANAVGAGVGPPGGGGCNNQYPNMRRQGSSQTRGGGASSSQSDHRSDGGYRSDGWYQSMQLRSQPPTSTKRPDGYRSEGSTESPKHAGGGNGTSTDHQNSAEQLVNIMQHQQNHSMSHSSMGRPRSASKHHHGGRGGSPRAPSGSGSNIQPPSNVPPLGMMQGHPQPRIPQQQQQHHFPPRASQSFQSFQRQESTGSFYSSHSAPTNCGVHKHHHGGHGHHGGGGGQHHHHLQHHHGPPGSLRGHHPPQNLESCSTQSSSSSASGPPDYATCAGAPPPSYDHQNSIKTSSGGAGAAAGVRGMIKGHPPNPPPRSDNPNIVQNAPKIPPHQGGSAGSGGSGGSSSANSRRKTTRAGTGDHPGGHSRSNSAIRQQQPPPQQQQPQQPSQQQQQHHHHPHHRHHNFAMNKSRQAGTNELYYMGEFYG